MPRVPPPIIALITAALIWFINWILPKPYLPGQILRIGGIAIILIGIAMDAYALAQFRREKTTFNPLKPERASALVTSGLYRITRNPMYLGMLLVLTGIALYLGSLWGFAPLLGFVAYMNRFQIRPEEAAMAKLFGADWAAYRQRVRRWL